MLNSRMSHLEAHDQKRVVINKHHAKNVDRSDAESDLYWPRLGHKEPEKKQRLGKYSKKLLMLVGG